MPRNEPLPQSRTDSDRESSDWYNKFCVAFAVARLTTRWMVRSSVGFALLGELELSVGPADYHRHTVVVVADNSGHNL
jgi:hypothetical protein